MDIARPDIARAKKIRRIVYGTLVVLGFSGISWFVLNLEVAAPPVDKDTVYMGTVGLSKEE